MFIGNEMKYDLHAYLRFICLHQPIGLEMIYMPFYLSVYSSGNFTILSFEMLFSRQVGFYVLQVYLPCAILVSLSWMTFYMEAADIGDRLSIGVTLILTMIFLLGYINQSLPKVR